MGVTCTKVRTDEKNELKAIEIYQQKKIQNFIKRKQVENSCESLKRVLVKEREFKRLVFRRENFGNKDMEKAGFKRLGNVIRKSSKQVQNIEAIFPKYEELRFVSERFKELHLLEHLNIEFMPREQVNNLEVDNLGWGLKKLIRLKSLCLTFPSCLNFNKLTFRSLMKGFRENLNLLRLSLYFHGCENLANIDYQSLGKALKTLSSLQELRLKFHCRYANRNDDIELSSLKKGLIRLVSLRKLSLVFHNGGVSDIGLSEISESIRKLSRLEDLILDFSGCPKITEIGLKSLGEALLNSLFKIELNFSHCEGISDEGFVNLHENFGRLANLKSLHLNYPGLIDAGLKSLSKSLKGSTSLQDLHLSLSNHSENASKGFSSLGDLLKNLPSLKRFTADIDCQSLDDTGLGGLIQGLKESSCLEEIKLVLFRSERITDIGVKNLGECLRRLSSLQKIFIDLVECESMTSSGVSSFIESLMKFQSLAEVEIYFGHCSQTIYEIKGKLQKRLQVRYPLAQIRIV